MTKEQAVKAFNKRRPSLTVTDIHRYKNGYVLTAVEDPSIIDSSDPYYYIQANGTISNFSPMMDLDGFLKALCEG